MKPTKILLIVLIAFCQVTLSQTASNNSEDEILEQLESSALPSLISNEFNKSSATTSLSNGSSTNVIHSGAGNQATVSQSGGISSVVISRYGNSNIDNVFQNGSGNELKSVVTGDANINSITQDGNNNKIDQSLTGDGMEFDLSQTGNNHELIQVENDGQTQGYTVKQTGNGMKVTITNRSGLPSN